MKSMIWVALGILVVVLLAFAGLAPLPGQKDVPSNLTQEAPPGKSPEPDKPSGPPHTKSGEPARGSTPTK
jgi:hypothetical protein